MADELTGALDSATGEQVMDILKNLSKEKLIIVVSHDKELAEKYADRIINVHPSLIPSFCGKGFYGLKVHEEALKYGVKVTGVTVHFVNEIPDGGEIIMQKAVYIQENDTPEILQKRVMEQAEWILLPSAVKMLSEKLEELK